MYMQSFSAICMTTSTRHPEFSVGGTLAGIILDRSNTQVQGLEKAVGKDVADKVVKGCHVIELLLISLPPFTIQNKGWNSSD